MAISKKPKKSTVTKRQSDSKKNIKKTYKAKRVSKVKPLAPQKLLVYGAGLMVALLVLIAIASFIPKDQDVNNKVAVNDFAYSDVIELESMSSSVKQGETFRVKIYTDSKEQQINAVQATVLYPSNILKLQKVDNNSSEFSVDAIQDSSEGKVQIVRGALGNGVTSKKLFTELEFVAISSGTADITFDTQETKVIESANSKDILAEGNPKNVSVEVL